MGEKLTWRSKLWSCLSGFGGAGLVIMTLGCMATGNDGFNNWLFTCMSCTVVDSDNLNWRNKKINKLN